MKKCIDFRWLGIAIVIVTILLLSFWSSRVRADIYEITAYTSRKGETDSTPFITASGKKTEWGIVATNNLPFGTRLKIQGFDTTFVVQDRMNKRYQGKYLDIWMPHLQMAKDWGRKQIAIKIIK